MASEELLTGSAAERRGMWPFYHYPRNLGNTPETVDQIFQCKLEDTLWQRLGNIMTTWGYRNREAPHLVSSIVHGIKRWRKSQKMKIPHNVPEPISDALAKKYEIGWLQALTGLFSHYWTEIQRLHLKSLRT